MGYTFEERLNALRSRKEEQTKEKIRRNGYMDEDDYGCVPPPEDFVFHPECNDKEPCLPCLPLLYRTAESSSR